MFASAMDKGFSLDAFKSQHLCIHCCNCNETWNIQCCLFCCMVGCTLSRQVHSRCFWKNDRRLGDSALRLGKVLPGYVVY